MKKRVKYPTLKDQGTYLLPRPNYPFNSINLELDEKGKIKVSAQMTVDRLVDERGVEIEGAKFGIALDGSASMTDLYGTIIGPFDKGSKNMVEPVAKAMISFLSDFDRDGEVDLIYWSVGKTSDEIEERGKFGSKSLANVKIRKPSKRLGRKTILLPALLNFEEKFSDAPWSMGIIITDGQIDDIEEVEAFTERLARKMYNKECGFMKFVLLGVGEHIDYDQMEALDNFVTTPGIDIWDSASANDWTLEEGDNSDLLEVFKEVMSDNLIIANSGKVLDDDKIEVYSRNDGFPARVEFTLNSDSKGFFLIVEDNEPMPFDLTEGIELLKNGVTNS